jgi:hypothetical protein
MSGHAPPRPTLRSRSASTRLASIPRDTSQARSRHRSLMTKSHALAQAPQRVRLALASSTADRDQPRSRWLRLSMKRRAHAPTTHAAARPHADPLDLPYQPRLYAANTPYDAPAGLPPPAQESRPSPSDDHEPSAKPAACTRSFHAFGAIRRIPTDC